MTVGNDADLHFFYRQGCAALGIIRVRGVYHYIGQGWHNPIGVEDKIGRRVIDI